MSLLRGGSLTITHDVMTRIIDRLFPVRPDTDEISRWEKFWAARHEYAIATGMIYEHDTPGKHALYIDIIDTLEKLSGHEMRCVKVAEFGSGSGYAGICAAERGAQVTLIDASDNALSYAGFISTKLDISRPPTLMKSDIILAPPKLGDIDICFNAGVLEHYSFATSCEIVKSMLLATVPGGCVIAMVPNLLSPLMIQRMMQSKSKGTERFYSTMSLRHVFQEAGLKGIKVGYLNAYFSVSKGASWHRLGNQLRRYPLVRGLSSMIYCCGYKNEVV